MKEKLILKNIGAIKDLKIDIKRFVVLIGAQATGKSTIAKIITIIKSVRVIAGKDNFKDELRKYGISNYFGSTSYIHYETKSYTFVYAKGEPKFQFKNKSLLDIATQITELTKQGSYSEILKQNKIKTKGFDKSLKLLEKRIDSLSDEKFLGELPGLEIEIKKLRQEVDETLSLEKQYKEAFKEFIDFTTFSSYIPAERTIISLLSDSLFSLISNGISLPQSIITFGSLYQAARLKVQKLNIPFFKHLEFTHSNNEDIIYHKQVKKKLKISEASSGFQTLIPLLIVLENSKKSDESGIGTTYVVEEPELNLFPKAQHDLIEHIISCVNIHSNIIITTHSPYVLSSLNNLLLKADVKKRNPHLKLKGSAIDSKDFVSYYLNNGKAKRIFNSRIGLISENEIDNISEYILNEFETLTNIGNE